MKQFSKTTKGFVIGAMLLMTGLTNGQTAPSTSQNYILVQEPKEPVTAVTTGTDAIRAVQYFDGLGRPKQSISVAATPDGKDIVTKIEYDGFGRQVLDFLPVPANQSNGAYIQPSNINGGYYQTEFGQSVWYSEKEIENSSLGRVMKQAASGDDWALGSGHEIGFEYKTNVNNEVRIYKVNGQTIDNYNITVTGYYAPNMLYKTETKDENGNRMEEFKDKQGRVVLKRSHVFELLYAKDPQPIQRPVDTYYVYDVYNNLTAVIPPLAAAKTNINETTKNNLCYLYQYDSKNRLVEKKLPGKGKEFMVYDRQNRLVATQDANQRTLGQWLVTRYDKFGRVAYTGIMIQNSTREDTQSEADLFANSTENGSNIVERDPTGFQSGGITIYYTGSKAFPKREFEVYTVNYYDDYQNFPASGVTGTVLEQDTRNGNANRNKSVKGLPTASFVRIPDTDDWESTTTVYDTKSRPVRSHKINHLGGYTKTDTKLNFNGLAVYVITTHKRTSNTPGQQQKIEEMMTYDSSLRLVSQYQSINGGTPQLIVENAYDKLGQLITKKVGGESSAPWQIIDYKYNIRGWLSQINDINQLAKPGQPIDLFGFKIGYQNAIPGYIPNNSGVKQLYNGNISQTYWRTASDNVLRGYAYRYDHLNRLTDAYYQKPEATVKLPQSFDEYLSYDLNGNITTLQRYSGDDVLENVVLSDDLQYTYNNNSNLLTKVDDSTGSSSGFGDGTNTNADFVYDVNGNMIKDRNKGINTITYNHLNLPVEIKWTNNKKINYLYNAIGEKVQKKVTNGTNIKTTDYLDGFQYNQQVLEFFPHAEGYVKATLVNPNKKKYAYNYVFNYTDHLGNIRVSYSKDPQTGDLKILDESHYYPFGLKHQEYQPNGFLNNSILGVIIAPVVNNPFKYKYNGKEFQDELGLNMYDMDMRQYDPAIARWVVMDPVVHHSMSPYNAFDNNPVFWADPSGMDATTKDFLRDLFNRSKSGDTWTNNNGIFVNSRTGEEAPAPESAYLAISLHGEGNFRPENMNYFRNYVESIQINGGIDELVAALSKSLGLYALEIQGYKVKMTNKRVMFMAIFSHGIEGEIFGDGGRISSSDLSKLKELVDVGGFSGVIYLGGCNAGTGMTESFAQHLANITGSTVIAMANDGVAPTGNERTAKTMTYGPKHGSKYDGNFYRFQANTPPTLIGANVDVIQLLDAQRNLDPNR